MSRVFTYGTLRQPAVRWLVIGRLTPAQPATLPDFRKQGLNLVPETGAHTPGEVFVVDAEALRRLDRYERLGVQYQRSRLILASGATAWVYRRLDND
ncbi:MAG: gamma-glutamylcyclotransferase [Desulfocapsa sp.]|nr:gamma-glutamylcyclotransferase [Desulfocapsa sp.]